MKGAGRSFYPSLPIGQEENAIRNIRWWLDRKEAYEEDDEHVKLFMHHISILIAFHSGYKI
eukprot:scaffold94148_cov27-Attheya_sp.AAC.1